MKFFEEQRIAKARLTKFKRLFYFTVVATAFATALVVFHLPSASSPVTDNPFGPYFFEEEAFWFIFGAVFLFIAFMAKIESMNMQAGGTYIAKLAGAVEVPFTTIDIKEKRLRNIVEEMSIAAGIIPPKVYVMKGEKDINAFAAGFDMNDAVVGVSQGCLDKLTRDELQGVVAHEIGHIVSGDMKLNLELMSYLFGLMGISLVGQRIMRIRSSNKKGNPLALMGVGLFVVGGLGYLLGLILRMSISRGQEFNADAKSVQYTRNPEGIGGALKKILAVKEQIAIKATSANKISHFYLFYPAAGLFATHPPLQERLQKIYPQFKFDQFEQREKMELSTLLNSDMSKHITSSFSGPDAAVNKQDPTQRALMDRALTFFQFVGLKQRTNHELSSLSDLELIHEMDVILGRLRSLSLEENKEMVRKIKETILDDGKILHKELLAYTLFKETLLPQQRPKKAASLGQVKDHVITIFSFLARISSMPGDDQRQSFEIGCKMIYGSVFPFTGSFNANVIIGALESLRYLRTEDKEKLLKAAKAIIEHDLVENFDENLFLKVFSQVLAVPVN